MLIADTIGSIGNFGFSQLTVASRDSLATRARRWDYLTVQSYSLAGTIRFVLIVSCAKYEIQS